MHMIWSEATQISEAMIMAAKKNTTKKENKKKNEQKDNKPPEIRNPMHWSLPVVTRTGSRVMSSGTVNPELQQ